jgi:HEAT repeat protein
MDTHVDTLIQQTQSDDPAIQRQSALELGQQTLDAHRQEAIQALCKLLAHSQLEVREAAEQALVSIRGRDVVKALLPYLKGPSTTVLNYAVEILGQIGDDGIDLIVDLLESKDHDVRKFGCDILGHLHYAEAVYDLIELLNDPHINVAIAAADALGKLGNPEAVPHLIRALHHPDTWMQCVAAEALGRIGDRRAVDAFLALSTHENSIVLYSVIKAMGMLHDERVVPSIIAILQSNPMFAASAVQSLENLAAQHGDRVYEELHKVNIVPSFVRLLSSDNTEVLRSAIHLAGKLRLQEAIQPLATLLCHENHEIADSAMTALLDIRDPADTIPVLQRLKKQQAGDTSIKRRIQQILWTFQQDPGARPKKPEPPDASTLPAGR